MRAQIKNVFPKVLEKLGLLSYLQIDTSVYLGDTKFAIPLFGTLGVDNIRLDVHYWMKQIIALLHSIKPGALLDIGANVGQTLLCAKSAVPNITTQGWQ